MTIFRPNKNCAIENPFSQIFVKIPVVDTQLTHLDETVLLSIQNTCLN